MSTPRLSLLAIVSATALLTACGSMAPISMKPIFMQDSLPDAVKVPAGHRVAMETVGMGDITYECRDKASAHGMTEWVFVGPDAVLNGHSGKQVGKYYGPPATWEAMDGSKVTATQLAVAPAGAGNIPYQPVGAGVSELSTTFSHSLEMGATLEDVVGTIHAHPTLGEAVQEAALRALGHALHI